MAIPKLIKSKSKAQYDAMQDKNPDHVYFLGAQATNPDAKDVRVMLNGKDFSGVKSFGVSSSVIGRVVVDGVDMDIKLPGWVTGSGHNTLGISGGGTGAGSAAAARDNLGLGTMATRSASSFAPLASPGFSGTPTAPTPGGSDDSDRIATTSFVKTAIANIVAGVDAMRFKGSVGTGGTVTTLPATHTLGDTYKVKTAGTYAGVVCEIGDVIICTESGTSSNDAHWTVVQANTDGAISLSNSAGSITDGAVLVFDGTSGKSVKPGPYSLGKSVPSGAVFTDQQVTASQYHYSPSSDPGAAISLKPSGESQIIVSIKRDNKGHVTSVEYEPLTKSLLGIYDATTSRTGLMTKEDKQALDDVVDALTWG